MKRTQRCIGLLLFAWVIATGFTCGPTLKDCQLQRDCTGQSQCVNFRCQPLDSCKSNSDCQAPRTCVNQLCTPPGCSSDKDCTNGRICKNRQCTEPVGPACNSDSDCKAPLKCRYNYCIPAAPTGCKSDADCTKGAVCKSNKCEKPPVPACQTDGDCPQGQSCKAGKCDITTCTANSACPSGQNCVGGRCVPIQTGTCKIRANQPSLFFSTDVGTSKTTQLTITNTGTGKCLLKPISLNNQTGDTGVFSISANAHDLAAGASWKLDITYKATKAGTPLTRAELEFFVGNNRVLGLRLWGESKPDTTLANKGWSTAYKNEELDVPPFIRGCFWSDGSFEAISERAFNYRKGFGSAYGNIMRTKDNGKEWQCTNCVNGNSWPRTAEYDIVDMNVTSMACHGDIGYIYGAYSNADVGTPAPLFWRKNAQSPWRRIAIDGHPLGFGQLDEILRIRNGQWFYSPSGLLAQIKPDTTDGKFLTESMLYFKQTQNFSYTHAFDKAHKTGLIVEQIKKVANGRFVRSYQIRYNTNDASVPKGTPSQDTGKYWPITATVPCTSCTINSALILGPKRFLLAGNETQNGSSTWSIWLTTDQGKQWKRVFGKQTKHLFSADLLRYNDKKIFAVGGQSRGVSGSDGVEGLLLYSEDSGETFKAIATSNITGIPLKQIPSLHGLVLSPDRKTLFALGKGTILRWKP